MNDLLKKLNTLVNATINDLTPSLPRFERTPDLDRRVKELRERINAALEHEDELQAAAQALRAEVARLDALADEALAKGQDAEARHLMQQLQRAEQRLSFAESDLRMHQRSAEELIQNVNMLEAAVADKKHSDQTAAASNTAASPAPAEEEEPLSPAEAYAKPPRDAAHQQAALTENAIEKISTLIKDAQDRTRERINALGDLLQTRDETPIMRPPDLTTTAPPESTPAADDPAFTVSDIPNRPKKTDDDDELAQRLRRLSKPE